MKDFKSMIKAVGDHGKVLGKGFVRMLYGASVAGLIGVSAYGFVAVPAEGGYIAVCDFIGAMATLVIAVTGMYAMGGNQKGAKK